MSTTANESVIVVGHEGTRRGGDALAFAATYARAVGGRLVVCGWYREEHPIVPGSEQLERALARIALEPLKRIRRERLDVPVELRAVAGRSPAHALHQVAEQLHAELVVVGSTRRGRIGRVLPGATALRLLQEAPCAVAVAPLGYARDGRGPREVRRIIVPFEPGLEGRRAALLAGDIAAATQASLLLVTVVDNASALYGGGISPDVYDDLARERRDAAQRTQAEAIADLPAGVVADGVVLAGAIVPELLRVVGDGADLVVMGSRGYGPLGRVLAGSVSGALVREAPCPVVIVPRALAERETARREPVAASVASSSAR